MMAYARLLKSEPQDVRVLVVNTDDHLKGAKQLHAKVFLKHGYITEENLLEDGIIDLLEDPYQEHAQYFIAERMIDNQWKLVAASRLIKGHAEKGHKSFQTLNHQEIYKRYEKQIAAIDPASCMEVSALVKESGESTVITLMLFRAMWQYSVQAGSSIWLMSCDAKLYARLEFLFGDALTKIGEQRFFKGHDVVPGLLDMNESLYRFLVQAKSLNPFKRSMKRALVKFFLAGLPKKYLDDKHLAEIERLRVA
jgi:hypothetical protein